MEESPTKTTNSQEIKLSECRQALPQILAVCVKNMLLLVFGMSLGFPTILIPAVSGSDPIETITMGENSISWIGSINLICVPLGCLISGYITHTIGRKMTMQIVNIPFLMAWLLFHYSTEVWHIFVASCMTGLSGGLLEAPVLTYVAEITQPHLRGMLSTTSTMSVVIGILSQFILGTFFSWRTVTFINCAIPIISFTSLIFIPETPVWLITKNRYDEAKRSIAWLRGWTTIDNIENEFQELYKHNMKTKENVCTKNSLAKKLQTVKLFAKRNFIRPYLLIMLGFFLGHFNGNTPFQAYAIKIFKAMKAPLSEYYSTVLMGLVQLLGCILSVTLISFLGKRVINFISLFASGICFLIIGTYAHLNNINYMTEPVVVNATTNEYPHRWISVTFLVGSAFFTYLGIKILPWILIGELFSNEIRATASGLSAGMGYVIGFLANKLFQDMVATFSLPGVFWFYGCVGIVGTVVLHFVLPETEGKSLFEITEHFDGGTKLRKSVRRKRTFEGNVNKAFESNENGKVESNL
ncbi:facilitated trehalose transporter Tret1 [Leptinotarsa decemlineata]|uniref:facilitated trehalose transporter Tret1 n=1 Tax=Leptinotarsa decemlineata TaxID=7539 RepID=UPI003D306CA7